MSDSNQQRRADADRMARLIAAQVGAATAAGIAGVLLGEYPLTGATPWAAGTVIGLVIAEIGLAINKVAHWAVTVVVGLGAGGAVLWAGRISTGHGVAPYPIEAWGGAALALGIGVWRSRPVKPKVPTT